MSKKAWIILLGAAAIVVAVLVGIRLSSGPEDNWICENNLWVKHGNPVLPMPTGGCGDKLIGGQKDEHGCLGPAGYNWCPSTSKCQRMWEEYCEEYKDQYRGNSKISNFNDCVATGNSVVDHNPGRDCTADGHTFEDTEDASNVGSIFSVLSPLPNEIITSPLRIKGAVRGNWYFEGSFPIRLEDEKGNIIAQTNAKAQSNWMSENMVPFIAEIKFDSKDRKNGFLVFLKDNPSGLTENSGIKKIPISFASQP